MFSMTQNHLHDPLFHLLTALKTTVTWADKGLLILKNLSEGDKYTFGALAELSGTSADDPNTAAAISFLTTCPQSVFDVSGVVQEGEQLYELPPTLFASLVQDEPGTTVSFRNKEISAKDVFLIYTVSRHISKVK